MALSVDRVLEGRMEKKSKLPDIVHLGYQDIALKLWDSEGPQGVYIADRPEIRIKDSLEGREVLNTLLHELIHATIYCYGLKQEFKDDEHEEKIVNVIGNALTEIFTRNPALAEWVCSNAKS